MISDLQNYFPRKAEELYRIHVTILSKIIKLLEITQYLYLMQKNIGKNAKNQILKILFFALIMKKNLNLSASI
jgi:hypothetical protein